VLREIWIYSASAWLAGIAVVWFQAPANGEVARLLEELVFLQAATAVIELDGNCQISSCRRICGWILVRY
jgi:hypothetical protein